MYVPKKPVDGLQSSGPQTATTTKQPQHDGETSQEFNDSNLEYDSDDSSVYCYDTDDNSSISSDDSTYSDNDFNIAGIAGKRDFKLNFSVNRIFISDKNNGYKFMIDTGAEICVLPPTTAITTRIRRTDKRLFAANGTTIEVYGEKRLTLNLGLRREYIWIFLIADVTSPIIGIDFLSHFDLLVDSRNKVLIDRETTLTIRAIGIIEKDCPTNNDIAIFESSNPFSSLLIEFVEITNFNKKSTESKSNVCHHIETTGPPAFSHPRRLSPEKFEAAKIEFQHMMKQGICRPSKSPWASPLHMVLKSNGEWRPCGDYRSLNAKTVPDRYPVPFLNDFTHRIRGKNIFSTIDLTKAYNQIPIYENDIEKTAIITPFGLFEFVKMPFGLRNATQTFQRHLDDVLRDLDFLFAYIDDIFVFSKDEAEHKRLFYLD